MIDLYNHLDVADFSHLRTTSIDGMSERIRLMVNKPITRKVFGDFMDALFAAECKAHRLKLYSIVGYPTETEDDWMELLEDIRAADGRAASRSDRWVVDVHCTPFRAMPATPMACEPMSYRNYRGEMCRVLGPGLHGNMIYQGSVVCAYESLWTESLPTVILSAICHRGSSVDTDAIMRVSRSHKFWSASMAVRVATLERYFDVDTLFGRFSPETLPSRYLRTYAKVEKLWGKPFK